MSQFAKRRARRRMVAVVVLTMGLFALAPTSHADPPVAQGWWWAAQNENLNLPSQLAGVVPEQAGPPGVPEDGLYVAGAAASEEAVATVKFFVAAGARPQSLELVLAAEPTGVPVIRLCEVVSSWTPVQQGPWGERPEFDCADDAPVGVVSPDNTTVTFDLSGLTLSGMIDFGLAPGLDPAGNVATFQAPIEKPGVDALEVQTSDDGSAGGGTFAPTTVATPPTSGDATPSPPATTARIPQAPAATGGSNLTPVARAPAPVTSGGGGDFSAAPVASSPAPVPMVPASSSNDLRTIGMVGLLALAAFYAWLTGQEGRRPVSLLAFGRGASGPVIDAEALQ